MLLCTAHFSSISSHHPTPFRLPISVTSLLSSCSGIEKEMDSLQSWIREHKLSSIGALWASGVAASLAYSASARSPLKPSLKLIHARMHAQALTLAVLSGAAVMNYWEAKPAHAAAIDSHAQAQPHFPS